jgi:hypothetical protein
MTNKITVREAVSNAIKAHGALKPKQVITYTGKPANNVYAMLSTMLKSGQLSRSRNGRYTLANAPALTAMTPDVEPVKTLPSRPELSFAKQLGRAQAEIDNLQKKLQDITIKYYDNLAVLRYLESKLTITKRN